MQSLWEQVLETDAQLFLWLNEQLNALDVPFVEALLRFANQLGSEMVAAVLVVGVVAVAGTRQARIRRLLDLAFSLGATAGFVQALKALYSRHRPQRALRDLVEQGEVVVPFNEWASRESFPSGHAAMAFGAATLLTLWAYGTGARWRGRLVLAVAFCFALLCGLARIHGALHYPLDVLAGAAAGVAGPLLVHGALALRRPKSGESGSPGDS